MFSSLLTQRPLIQHDHTTQQMNFKNVKFHYCSLVYVNSGSISLKKKNVEILNMEGSGVFFIEKNTTLSITVEHKQSLNGYMIHHIHNDDLQTINGLLRVMNKEAPPSLDATKDVFHFYSRGDDLVKQLFSKLNNGIQSDERISIILYILSRMKDNSSIYSCISRSIKTSFSEVVRCVLEKNVSNQCCAKLVCEELNLSIQTLRKKLYSDGYKFNDLLLDVRMRQALHLILTTDFHVNTLAHKLGFSNASYFISLFKKYYGVTPKQLAVQLKSKLPD